MHIFLNIGQLVLRSTLRLFTANSEGRKYCNLEHEVQKTEFFCEPISGRVDRASATEMVDKARIPVWSNHKTIKIDIRSFPALRSTIQRDSVKPPLCVINR